jgi:RHS repeat-associated protein
VQELNGSSVVANLLTGLGIDEYLMRTDSGGASSFLLDALGSTIALSDAIGGLTTSYTYAPFGETSRSGSITSNTIDFTGREDDATGLKYYRARYYHPGLLRFVSEDPIGLSGGPNQYTYVNNRPVDQVDPLGLDAFVRIFRSERQPFGHAGLGVNTTATVGFYPVEGAATRDLLLLRAVPGQVASDNMPHLTPTETFRISTTAAQDRCLTDFIDRRTANPGTYRLAGRACGEFVQDALHSCGITDLGAAGLVGPFALAERLRLRHYQRVP